MTFTDPIALVKGVGSLRRTILESSGISVVGDLLSYLPYAYEDSTDILTISEARETVSKTPLWEMTRLRVTVKATLEKVSTIRTRRGLILITSTFIDDTSDRKIKAIWFNQPYKQHELHEGKSYILYGRVQKEGSSFSFQSPKTEEIVPEFPLKKLGGILPVYRRMKTITTTYMRKYIQDALQECVIEDFLPQSILKEEQLPDLHKALSIIHSPVKRDLISYGFRRLAIQELLELRQDYEDKFIRQKSDKDGVSQAKELAKLFSQWIPKLPYKLTSGQEKILQSALELVGEGKFLDALVYGDVGSGKTIVALLLAIGFTKLGYSAILIAPTTILAAQHVKTANSIVKILGMTEEVSILPVAAGKVKVKTVEAATIYVGTQAILHNEKLLNDKVVKLVCIDEQHRFGVEQRSMLKKDGRHVLTLSATPIPRTLALSFLGFSEAYILEERPEGRKEVISRLVPRDKEEVTYNWILQHLEKGEQVYIVFPRIESEEESEKQSLLAMSEVLKEQFFSKIPSALLYGGLKEEEKLRIMADFSSGKIRLLFSTSVIEVGVDIANATVIAIHGAELFGLAQLHQLRGRVGRSSQQGYCLLFAGTDEAEAAKRLEYFSTHSEGIDVSEYDLKNRGTGTLLGNQQSGLSELRMALVTDLGMVKEAMVIYQKLKDMNVGIARYFRVKSTNG